MNFLTQLVPQCVRQTTLTLLTVLTATTLSNINTLTDGINDLCDGNVLGRMSQSITTTGARDDGPAARVLALTAQTDERAWLIGGEDVMTAETRGDAWELDLATNTWTVCPPVDPIRHSAMEVIGNGGSLGLGWMKAREDSVRLLIFGGLNEQGQVNEEQTIYDPDEQCMDFILTMGEYAP